MGGYEQETSLTELILPISVSNLNHERALSSGIHIRNVCQYILFKKFEEHAAEKKKIIDKL